LPFRIEKKIKKLCNEIKCDENSLVVIHCSDKRKIVLLDLIQYFLCSFVDEIDDLILGNKDFLICDGKGDLEKT
jgi:hypothetical protein